MRNSCTLYADEGDFTSNPLSTTNKSLALDISKESAALSNDLHSLHLKSLIEDYLEPSSHSCNPSLLKFPSSPFNHNTYYEDHKSLTQELQAILQNVEENYGELRKEVMGAIIRKGETLASSYEKLHVLVLEHLRKLGFNAGICKSQRDPLKKNSHQRLFPAEDYEYMDVILQLAENGTQAVASERVIIDLRFRSQFEIARPSTAYVDLLKLVPIAYVGIPRVLQKIIRFLSEAMKSSLHSQGMSLPPWRRHSFLHSKWLSPNYSRSTFAPLPLTFNLNCIIRKPSSKREHSPSSTNKSPSSLTTKRESSHSIIDNSPCDSKDKLTSFLASKRENSHSIINNPPPKPPLHVTSKRENSHSIINNPPPQFVAKPPLPIDSKRVLKSCNSASHILPSCRNSPNKQSSIQSGEPIKVPWQLPPLSNPPSSLKRSETLVGALTIALHYASDSSTISGPLLELS